MALRIALILITGDSETRFTVDQNQAAALIGRGLRGAALLGELGWQLTEK
jgi:hypothetical protein